MNNGLMCIWSDKYTRGLTIVVELQEDRVLAIAYVVKVIMIIIQSSCTAACGRMLAMHSTKCHDQDPHDSCLKQPVDGSYRDMDDMSDAA